MTLPDLSPELATLLRSSRPAASPDLRVRVRALAQREAAATTPIWTRLRLPSRRAALVVLPAAAALAIASAGVLGVTRSDAPTTEAFVERSAEKGALEATSPANAFPALPTQGAADSTVAPTDDRAKRVSATISVEVDGSDGVADAARKAQELTLRLGGYVVSSSVVTGDSANAAFTLRVPVTRVQEAVAGLSSLGTIVSQQVSVEDLQGTLDQLERRERSVRAQIALITARLESESLDAETRVRLEERRKNLRAELRGLRSGIAGTNAEARMATIQLAVVTPEGTGAVPVPSRVDRTLDEALNVLVWEGVITLAILIVAAPFALVAIAVWLGNRLYRRREDERLLTAN